MNRAASLLLLAAAIGLASCSPTGAAAPADPTEMRIAKHTLIKQICLNGVSYYATWITDSVDSIAGRSYLVVGGPVFAKGSSAPTPCEGASYDSER